MIVYLYGQEIKSLNTKLSNVSNELSRHRWEADKSKKQIDLGKLKQAEVDAVYEIVKKQAQGNSSEAKHYQSVERKMTPFMSLSSGEGAGAPVKKLDTLPAAVKGFFKDSKRKWMFVQSSDGQILPWFITDVVYKQAWSDSSGYVPAHVILSAKAYKRGTVANFSHTWWLQDLGGKTGKTVHDLFAQFSGYKETEHAVEDYLKEFVRYSKLTGEIGLQMVAHGEATSFSEDRYGWGRDNYVSMVREGVPAKVVLDDLTEEDKSNTRGRTSTEDVVADKFWKEIEIRDFTSAIQVEEEIDVEDKEDIGSSVHLPLHPYLKAFDLEKDKWIVIHSANLEDYDWNKTLIDKLVLKKDHKDLISLLMHQTTSSVEDIIKGKMNGVIVLATGNPGLGKTLTAEVFSEVIEKPLYTVQCSQLGLDVNEIEKNLANILKRAARWGAILLIDEADVYIRRRGEDIIQNAIVGVFLRLIEYYRGVLFMTSNRGDVIDDAILSRATAWIKYESPDEELLSQIWKVLGEQYKADFSEKEIAALAKKYSGISGRSVRNLLKLANLLVKGTGDKITQKTIATVASYQALESEQK